MTDNATISAEKYHDVSRETLFAIVGKLKRNNDDISNTTALTTIQWVSSLETF